MSVNEHLMVKYNSSLSPVSRLKLERPYKLQSRDSVPPPKPPAINAYLDSSHKLNMLGSPNRMKINLQN